MHLACYVTTCSSSHCPEASQGGSFGSCLAAGSGGHVKGKALYRTCLGGKVSYIISGCACMYF